MAQFTPKKNHKYNKTKSELIMHKGIEHKSKIRTDWLKTAQYCTVLQYAALSIITLLTSDLVGKRVDMQTW